MAEQHHAAAGSEVDDFGDDVDFSDSAWDDDAADVAAAGGAVAGGAAAGGAAAATRTAAGSAAASGVPRNNAQFKTAARAAFAEMGLGADSRIPPAQVLARDPAAASGGRDRCPPALWALIKSHGGYIEEGLNGVSRARILNQFRLWRKDAFGLGAGARPAAAAPVSRVALLTVLQQLVPDVDVLIVETAGKRTKLSTVTEHRPLTKHVEIWARADCDEFWAEQRSRIITVMVDAAHDHPTDKLYVDNNTHAHSAYAGLCTILRRRDAWPFQRGTSCNFCMVQRAQDACDCLWMVAYEAVDMFIDVVLGHVDDSSAPRLTSPPAEAILPIESADALYNIAGALLYKVRQRTTGSFRGIDEHQRASCTVFFVAHSVGQDNARQEALPVEKVVREQYGVNTLTYVSASLYNFFCRLELVYWFNLNLQFAAALRVNTLQSIDAFAREDPHVRAAWQQCMERVAGKTGAAVSEIAELHEFVFSILAKKYRNTRGKEFATVFSQMNSRCGEGRTSMVRDQAAARAYAHGVMKKNCEGK